ncbi:MAG: 7TM diverse intracellular signaling domain-containing protein [Campylobacterota bacterium]|nr:7TM diverse intracellular signaling domain-containing protein [Campylobacterota bacterium]
MFKFIKYFIIVFLLIFSSLSANIIDFSKANQNILDKSKIYIDDSYLNFKDIKDNNQFKANTLKHLNLGFVSDKSLWIKVVFENQTDSEISRVLEIKNPLLEKVVLHGDNRKVTRGMLHTKSKQTTINPSFDITLSPHSVATYYLHITNKTTALRFGLFLKDKESFLHDDYVQQTLVMIFFGIIIALLIYNTLLYVFTNNRAYIYYSLYLSALLYQQLTYLGITPLWFPESFVHVDNLIVIFKVNIMYILAAIFAQSFLQTSNYPKISKIYRYIIFIAIIEIPIFGTQNFYYPEVGILTGLIFVLFNIYAGIYIYLDGYKQARFFVVGWAILAIGFILMIFDGLGVISIMHKYSNLIMYSTALEAIVLSLAFTDHYKILREAKKKADAELLDALKNSKTIIEKEIFAQTKELHSALDSNKILLKELQHRTKNNLQLIISLVRMQADSSETVVKDKLLNLEGRIAAISKTHQLLYLEDDLQHINMDEYIYELCSDIEDGIVDKNIRFVIEVREIYMPFREASYIGLIINELVTNSIKYADIGSIVIVIEMIKDKNSYLLKIRDNGKGYDFNHKSSGMGLTLVRALVENQLSGSMRVENKNGVTYMIEYKI